MGKDKKCSFSASLTCYRLGSCFGLIDCWNAGIQQCAQGAERIARHGDSRGDQVKHLLVVKIYSLFASLHSIVEPERYADRFLAAMQRYIRPFEPPDEQSAAASPAFRANYFFGNGR